MHTNKAAEASSDMVAIALVDILAVLYINTPSAGYCDFQLLHDPDNNTY